MARFLDAGRTYTIRSGELSASFAPEMGGRMLALSHLDGTDIVIPMTAHRFSATEWPRAGAYPLFPYHNRLAHAVVRVDSANVGLQPHPAALPHTLHGPAHSRPWHVTILEPDRIVMALNYLGDADWPWDFTAVQDFRVQGSTLAATFTLTNEASDVMPGGMGWHPYFASIAQPSSDANFVWSHREDYLPNGQKEALVDRAEQEGRPTSYLQDWKSARIVCEAGVLTTMTASSPFDHLVVHRGDPAHVCVEPVTHVPNAWNLKADASDVGARLLHPGEVLGGTFTLEISA